MSDFEQWFEKEFANVDPTEYRGNTFQLGKSNMEYGWNAAKQSMQGEHVGTIGHDFETGNPYVNWRIDTTQIAGAKLYTRAPDSAARIAEQDAEIARLQKELEESRKDAERYRWLRENYHGFEMFRNSTIPHVTLDREVDSAMKG